MALLLYPRSPIQSPTPCSSWINFPTISRTSRAHLPFPLHARTPHASSGGALPRRTGVVVVGAGLAGLAAAIHLHSSGVPFLLLEASDAVGGRVRTDQHPDGFLLDRGFQIFLTAYPEAQRLLDYAALDLQPFYPGALIYHDGSFHRVADPFRRPLDGLLSLPNPIGTIPDKLRIGLARVSAAVRSDQDLLTASERPILDRLRAEGFGETIVDRFFRPFFGGIFFDRDLATTSRLFDFVFKCLALGENTLPANGIAEIPEQLCRKLPSGSVRFNTRVASVRLPGSGGSPLASIALEGGDVVEGELGVIVAVEQPEAGRLLPQDLAGDIQKNLAERRPPRTTACLYFSADIDRVPVQDPILILNGSGKGVVNNMFFATNVARSYGPSDGKQALVSVSVVGQRAETPENELIAEVVRELAGWFGAEVVESWRHLRTYRVGFAQPDQCPPTNLTGKDPKIAEGIYMCGDHWASATFEGALVSGRKAAEALMKAKTKVLATSVAA